MSNQKIHESKYNQILSKIPICHRLPDRTFNIRGYYFPVCARCTGLYLGAILFFTYSLFFLIGYSQTLILLAFISIIPMIIDGLTQFLGFRESYNGLRFITGFVAGFGLALLFLFFKITLL
jgi:uncharacterized membrane protein